MRCIFCLQDRPSSLEHVFPLAIGGTVTTDRVCARCNSTLGSRVDSGLSDFLPILARRAQLGLAGNSGATPAWHDMLMGEATLVGAEPKRIRTSFDAATGKLDIRQHYHAVDVVRADGQRYRRITIDGRDVDQLPTIIKRERKRRGLRALTPDELAATAADYTIHTVDKPVVQRSIPVSFAYLRHALFKMAYELAFLWLTDDYLSDQLSAELREAILSPDIASTDHLPGTIGWAEECGAFKNFWSPHANHHLAYANEVAGVGLVVCVRIFDIYGGAIVVSRDPRRYLAKPSDYSKLRFLAMDSVRRRMIDTTFAEETLRLGHAMSTEHRLPPFPDPLVAIAA